MSTGGFTSSGRAFPLGVREVCTLLCSRKARRALRGLMLLRRAYEHVLVMAVVEGARQVQRPYYEAYVDALNILVARATFVARSL